jgi:hypothetical protein
MILFNPENGELKVESPSGAPMLALAMLELARHELLRKIFDAPRAVVPARVIPRVS